MSAFIITTEDGRSARIKESELSSCSRACGGITVDYLGDLVFWSWSEIASVRRARAWDSIEPPARREAAHA